MLVLVVEVDAAWQQMTYKFEEERRRMDKNEIKKVSLQ